MAAQGSDVTGDLWSCPVCKYECADSDAFCAACGTQVSGFVCSNCNRSYEPGNWKCPHCSTQMAFDPKWIRQNRGPFNPECGKCGNPNSPSASFCSKCGTLLPEVTQPPGSNLSKSTDAESSASPRWQTADSSSREIHNKGFLFIILAASLGVFGEMLRIPWWLVVPSVAAIWVLLDGRERKANAFLWALGTFLFLAIILPLYIAYRPLKSGERRDGGRAWNVLRNIAISWTIVMAAFAVMGIVEASGAGDEFQTEAEQIGFGIGMMVAMFIIGAAWFFPMVGAVVLGFFLRTASVELGPTGPLADADHSVAANAGAPAIGTSPSSGDDAVQPQQVNPAQVDQTPSGELAAEDESQCSHCGHSNDSSKNYCGECGTRLPDRTCPSCHAENRRTQKFCGDCGTRLIPA